MISICISEILNATGGKLLCGDEKTVVTSVTTDSRKAEEGSLFVAICGENSNGHDYIEKAILQGAACVLAEKEVQANESGAIVLVENTVRAMGKIAHLIMEKLSVPTVSVIGSVGKTTTRDMTYAVMSKKYKTLTNKGNFNNEIGVPLTVFSAEDDISAAVIEMGMDHFGEIDRLSKICVPDVVLMTNIGMSHIEILGSQENIYRAKAEVFQNLKPDGVAILNGDDAILMAHKEEITQKVITVGVEKKDADLVATDIVSGTETVSFHLSCMGHAFGIILPIPGEHNVLNAMLAAAAGIYYGVSDEEIQDALGNFSMTKMRMDIIKTKMLTVINDCYNAAPASVSAALSVLGKYETRTVAVLGDIKALGAFSYDAHFGLGAEVTKNKIDVLVTVGKEAEAILKGALAQGMDEKCAYSAQTVEEAKCILKDVLQDGDTVLVKASRAMELERITEYLKETF